MPLKGRKFHYVRNILPIYFEVLIILCNFVPRTLMNRVTLMLSILIPTYNYDCSALVESLKKQCDLSGVDYEIIVADDGSTNPIWMEGATVINRLENCRFIRRDFNVGRSRIRNFLASEAKGDMLLFMDQDGKVIRDDFIDKYLAAAEMHDVVCGGIRQNEVRPPRQYSLRYKYETKYEKHISPERLNADPQSKFRSFCFLIHRYVANRVRMDERFSAYGYEDVKYGMDLRRAGFTIYHIDNPLANDDLEENPQFVRKTEVALTTLHQFEEELADDVSITRHVRRLRKLGLIPIVRIVSRAVKVPIRNNLCGLHPMVSFFNLYKLMYYISINND